MTTLLLTERWTKTTAAYLSQASTSEYDSRHVSVTMDVS